jgi:serine/threonine-protein kinase HipA
MPRDGDAHAKNNSMLFSPSGSVTIAPLYDVMSTLIYGDERLAMYVDNVRRTDHVTGERLLNEVASWGISRNAGTEIIEEILDHVGEAGERAENETAGVPSDPLNVIGSQSELLRQALS